MEAVSDWINSVSSPIRFTDTFPICKSGDMNRYRRCRVELGKVS
jgi:hypothetical protein